MKWTASTVKSILTNEKYKGDALLQKTFTPDYLTKKTKKNDGQIPQYYVENSHPAIITAEVFDAVQTEMERRQGTKSRYSGVDILASKLVCGECGSSYRPKVWHSTDQYRRTIYQCEHKYKGGCKCSTPNLTAEAIHAMFIRSFNEMITNKNEILRNLRKSIALASDMTELESKRDAANNEVLFLADIVEKLIAENAHIPQDQKEYNKKYKTAIERYKKAKSAYDAIIALIKDENKRIQRMKSFIQNVQKLGVITEFDEMLWGLLVDKVVVYSRDDIRVEFKKYVE